MDCYRFARVVVAFTPHLKVCLRCHPRSEVPLTKVAVPIRQPIKAMQNNIP